MGKSWIILLLLFCSIISSGQSANDDSLRVFNQLDSTFRATYENDLATAIKITDHQDRIANLLNQDTLILKVAYNKGDIMLLLGFQDMAMESFFKVLKIAEKIKHVRYESEINYNIASMYCRLGDYTRAKKHINHAYSVAVAGKEYGDTVNFNYCLAEIMVFTGKPEEGISLLKNNIKGAKDLKNYSDVVVGLDELSFFYFEIDRNKLAVEALKESLPFLDLFESNYRRVIVYQHLCESYIGTEQWDSASAYLEKAFKYAHLIKSPEWLYECYKDESWILAHNGKYKEALIAHRKFGQYKDTVFQNDYNNKIAALSSKYALEKKQSEIKLLQKDNALRAEKIKEQRLLRNVILLVTALLIVTLVASFRGWMSRKTRKLQQMFSRTLLKNQEADKKRIAGELHDSIGQNILFIKNQIASQPDNEKKNNMMDAITATIEDVRNISKELYPNQLEKYGLSAAVNTLADKTMEATGIFVSATLESVDSALTSDARINCYRIIQECISNSVKHAAAKAIRITGEIQKNKVVLTIQDNGKGFNSSILESKAQSSFGLLGIEERARLLDGKAQLETSSAGTKTIVTFPIS
jgi:signal transduction histidine kinase